MTDIQRKALSEVEWKADKAGAFRAVVATYNVVDKDGDVTVPGALDTEKAVILSPWNHSSTGEGKDPPVGYATISTVGDRAIAEGQFILDTPDGRAAYTTTKTLNDVGIGQWSYAFRIPAGGASTDRKDLEQWPTASRLLKRVSPIEVSQVYSAAGEGTQTLSVKSFIEAKAGARLSKESRTRLRSLAADLLAFIGEAEEDPTPDAPKSDKGDEFLSELLATSRYIDRVTADRFIDLRVL